MPKSDKEFVEIKKTINGYHVTDHIVGKEHCFETARSLLDHCLVLYLPKDIGDELKLIPNDT